MRALLAGLLVLGIAFPVLAQEGQLQRIREAVDRPATESPAKKDSSSSSSGDDDDGLGSLVGPLVGCTLLAPFALPHAAMKDDFDRSGYFPHYPHDGDHPGYLRYQAAECDNPEPLRTISARLSVEYGLDGRDIDRVGSRFVLDTTSRFGLQLTHDYFHEDLDCGCTDYFNLGSADVTFRFAQSSHAQMFAGVGANVIDTRYRTRYGCNFLYGIDVFPSKPFVLCASVEGGTLGSAGLFRARGTIGVNYRWFEGFVGYDYLNIGGFDLQGPLAGLRLWF